MMMRICRDNKKINNNSSLSLPSSLHDDFSRTFHRLHNHHQAPSCCSCPPPPPPPPSTLDALHDSPVASPAGTLSGENCSSEGYQMDLGLMSCTESLGFESSDEISTLDFGSNLSCYSTSNNAEDSPSCSSPFFPPCFRSSSSNSSTPTKRFPSENNIRLSEKKEFPPPLTTMSHNGRRDFILRPERKDGRLKIIKVAIERPEVLYASRQNGRLTLHLVRNVPHYHEHEQEQDDEFQEEERETINDDVQEQDQETEDDDEEEEERESWLTRSAAMREEEERNWEIPAAGLRRCHQYELHVWGQQQRRWVTTIM